MADWFLVREQFEPVPFSPGLYRLTEPEHDGLRRTRQAVHDLRALGYQVQADSALDPALTPRPVPPTAGHDLTERRSRIVQAAAARPSIITALASTPPVARRAVGTADTGRTRGRRA
ncbi:hypothetical protein OG604_36915 [Streptomyces sp. NBC_01231]|nr:hypothetical protein OG604_36915 [Streptomyces sp. NBC_01231]